MIDLISKAHSSVVVWTPDISSIAYLPELKNLDCINTHTHPKHVLRGEKILIRFLMSYLIRFSIFFSSRLVFFFLWSLAVKLATVTVQDWHIFFVVGSLTKNGQIRRPPPTHTPRLALCRVSRFTCFLQDSRPHLISLCPPLTRGKSNWWVPV